MIVKKQWHLCEKDTTALDVKFIISLGCSVQVYAPEPAQITGPDGRLYYYYPTNAFVHIVSTCEKQESMLKLKFGDSLVLQQVVHTTPDSRTPFPFS